ncbi:hypothetical protein [Brevundimonas lenta]|uniref:Uncharacterized protein n=1 Tax=Brevundimonas lenta TaxID=424796 RepID=A0A7W6J9Z1_9CAUL|nr:hypothetical protein [Brevundimonas lenta]MBB4081261.1 hypothetical protein [Brevundimonas lenta]
MKLLRIILALAVLGYVGWLAWPLLSPLLDGGAPDVTTMRAGVEADAGGDLFGLIPAWAFWGAAIGLYLVAALMLGSGNPKAAVAYFLGFIADAVLRLAINAQGGGEAAARSMAAPDAFSGLPVDPVWVVLGVLLLVGVLVVVAGRRVHRRREAGQLAY